MFSPGSFSIGGEMSQRKAKKELQATDELGRTARVIGSLNFLFILFAFLFQVVLASVLVSIFQCDAVERFGPKYLVAGCLGWPLGRNRYWSFFSNSNTRGAWPLGTCSGTRLLKCSGWARLSSNPSRTNSISQQRVEALEDWIKT